MIEGADVAEMEGAETRQVIALLNAYYGGSHEFVDYTEESFAAYLREEGARAYVVRDGRVRGVATFFRSGWGNKIDLFAVEPGPTARLLGDMLVKKVEEMVAAERLYTILEEGDPTIPEWRARGYSDDGGWCQMVAQLSSQLPLPPIKCDAKLRPMEPDDLEDVVNLANSSFGFQRLSADCIDEWKREDPSFGPEWIFVAECEGRLVSMLVSKPDSEYNRNFGGRRGYLGPAATLSGYRNRGLAAALTVMAMNFLKRKGMESVNLYTSTKNAPSLSLLKKLGFSQGKVYVQLSKRFGR